MKFDLLTLFRHHHQVRAKAQKITAEHMDGHSRTLNKFLLRHPLPAIKGPNESLFIIDKHHLSLALHQLGVEQVLVGIPP